VVTQKLCASFAASTLKVQ